jgi:hypothetical protein
MTEQISTSSPRFASPHRRALKLSCTILGDPSMIASGWLGYPGATEDQISNLEARLGKTLPRSYRAFFKTSNGFQQPGMFVPRLLTVDEIEWVLVKSLDTIDMWKSNGLEDLTDALAISPFQNLDETEMIYCAWPLNISSSATVPSERGSLRLTSVSCV